MYKKLRYAIVGYGRMGKITKQVLIDEGCIVSDIIDPAYQEFDWRPDSLEKSDTAICFTSPGAGYETTKRILEKGVDAVISTTKFYTYVDSSENDKMMEEFRKLAIENDCRMIYGANFSVGMNIFWKTLKPLANTLAKRGYDVAVEERHHIGKEDIAATAKVIARILIDAYPDKNRMVFGDIDRKREDDEITIGITRVGNIPGTHKVIFDSEIDTIELTHTVRDPKLFAKSAINAACWLRKRPPGLYSVKDMLKSY
jgi:4-hydroxy-tetrahydrodipicolinate reductase